MKPGFVRHLIAAGLVTGVVVVVVAATWWWRPGFSTNSLSGDDPLLGWAAAERQERIWREAGVARKVSHEWVPLSRISLNLQVAVLVSEDVRFLQHGAVDVRAIGDALTEWVHGRRLRGASTITQQLARLLFLSNQRNLSRKVKEARLAWWLERSLDKRRILELYLNVVDFGPGLAGAESASRRYYAVGAGALAPEQAAGLAATIPAPARDNPDTASPQWRARRDVILQRSARATWLRRELERLQEH